MTQPRTIIAIDPGLSGGIAIHHELISGPCVIECHNMPQTNRDIWDLLESNCKVTGEIIIRAFIERVGTYMPGNSGPAAVTFATHVGALQMALIGLKVPHEYITPKTWEYALLGNPDYPSLKDLDPKAKRIALARRKAERKKKIKSRMQQEYPGVNVTLANADALGILWYACSRTFATA